MCIRDSLYAAPLCRPTDEEAWREIDRRLGRLDPDLVEKRRATVAGAEGMWGDDEDPLSPLDTNEGHAPRLIRSAETILGRVAPCLGLGIGLLCLDPRHEPLRREGGMCVGDGTQGVERAIGSGQDRRS